MVRVTNDSLSNTSPHQLTVRESSLVSADPLHMLLRRYEAELKAFDDRVTSGGCAKRLWDRIARNTWVLIQDEIIHSRPPATTAAGALAALDHVLQSENLFADRKNSDDLQMLWHFVKAARDYIAAQRR